MVHILVGLGLLAGAFGLRMIRNASKLAAIKAELEKVGDSAVADVKALITKLRAKL